MYPSYFLTVYCLFTEPIENTMKLLKSVDTSASTSASISASTTASTSSSMSASGSASMNVDETSNDNSHMSIVIDSDEGMISDGEQESQPEIDENFQLDDNDPTLPTHYRCASHTLNLIATMDSMKSINANPVLLSQHSKTIKKCEELWKCLASPKKREKMTDFFKCNLKRPVPTRWNSLYDALSQLVSLKDSITSFQMQLITETTRNFDASDFLYIEEYLLINKPLARAVDELQAEVNYHFGYLLPTLISVKRKWLQLLISRSLRLCEPLLNDLIASWGKRFENFFEIKGVGEHAAIAALIHPKFKKCWIPCLTEAAQKKIKKISQDLIKSGNDAAPAPAHVDHDDFFDFGTEAEFNPISPTLVPEGQEKNELMSYLQQSSKSLDILHEFPNVKELFIKYNTALPSSAPVERLFSQTTLLDSAKFNRMSDAYFERRVISKINQGFVK